MQKIEHAVDRLIYLIRDRKVMLDEDLAGLYQVQTKVLVQAVKRNIKRFPPDCAPRMRRRKANDV